jgi:GH15 family glucan-1,4-alpha-glucosidase
MDKIQDYAVIGNGRSMALLTKTGSIDWLCWPRFDSPPVFAALLDASQGHWAITPQNPFRVQRSYLHETNILQTIFTTTTGKVVITDLMPVMQEHEKKEYLLPEQDILRKVNCVAGHLEMKMTLSLSGRIPWQYKNKHLGIRAEINGGILMLRTNMDLTLAGPSLEKTFTLHEGDTFYFSLSFAMEAPIVLPMLSDEVIERTHTCWKTFSSRISYTGPYRDHVMRSSLTLKLMIHSPSGSIIASPTTSLPEKIGADLNWDYRYCWLRDASLTIYALMKLNLQDEAEGFVSWLLHATHLSRPKLKVLYDTYGRNPQKEKTVDDYRGYADSHPVRFGNMAATQDQLDIYGEVICAASYVLSERKHLDQGTQRMLKQLAQYICQHWADGDAGMWEIRGRKEYFTHSCLLCWVGLQHFLRLFHKGLIQHVDVYKIKTTQDRIAQAINQSGWNDELQSFTSTLRGNSVDSNLLLLPWYNFIPNHSARMKTTYEQIRRQLSAPNGLLFRNREQNEGVFLLCSLWEAEFLAFGGGSLQEAKERFEYILNFANDVGLLSEEIDSNSRDFLGNFPLTFSHLGVINAALAIEERERTEALSKQKAGV